MKIVSQASLMERVTVTRNGCWVWKGARSKEGYGVLRSGDAQRPATRLFWESFVGIIPAGYRVLSRKLPKCAGKACCNPAHHRLQGPVVEKDLAVSKQGHPLTLENTVVENRNGRRFERCRICRRDDLPPFSQPLITGVSQRLLRADRVRPSPDAGQGLRPPHRDRLGL